MNASLLAGRIRRWVSSPLRLTVAALAVACVGVGAVAIAAPPAGTTIGNQATATYTDAASNSYTVTSNPVTTIVQQVAGLTLTANGTRVAAPGGQAVFPHHHDRPARRRRHVPLRRGGLGARHAPRGRRVAHHGQRRERVRRHPERVEHRPGERDLERRGQRDQVDQRAERRLAERPVHLHADLYELRQRHRRLPHKPRNRRY